MATAAPTSSGSLFGTTFPPQAYQPTRQTYQAPTASQSPTSFTGYHTYPSGYQTQFPGYATSSGATARSVQPRQTAR
jgi:hypothetical protein